MNSAEARDRFSDALDGELSSEEQAAFQTALERDEALRSEYEELHQLVVGMHRLRKVDSEVHLLVGVQEKLRANGRRPKPRELLKETNQRLLRPTILALWLFLIVLLVVALLQLVELDTEAPAEPPESTSTMAPAQPGVPSTNLRSSRPRIRDTAETNVVSSRALRPKAG